MGTYACSDLHGMYDLYAQIKNFIKPEDTVILPGDFSWATYLEEAKKEEQPKDGVPIHRLLNAWYNTESCELSKVDEEGMYRGVYLWP